MTEDNPTVVAAELRTAPELKKLARAYIALARQLRDSTNPTAPAEDEPVPAPKGAA